MELTDLQPIKSYCAKKNITFQDAMSLALANNLEVYYVTNTRVWADFEPMNTGGVAINRQYAPGDIIPIPEGAIKKLWVSKEVSFEDLMEASEPEGYMFHQIMNLGDCPVNEDCIYAMPEKKKIDSGIMDNSSSSNTALKVIGLLMHHLAKTPKFASRSSPNKSQIKELLLDLAEELNVKDYGLSKVDERLLSDAMKYLETQKN